MTRKHKLIVKQRLAIARAVRRRQDYCAAVAREVLSEHHRGHEPEPWSVKALAFLRHGCT